MTTIAAGLTLFFGLSFLTMTALVASGSATVIRTIHWEFLIALAIVSIMVAFPFIIIWQESTGLTPENFIKSNILVVLRFLHLR